MYPQIQRLCGPRVSAPGWLQGEELQRAYAQADIFAFPSVTETFGNVVLEAMSCGLPVVVMNGGGAREIPRGGVDGLIAHGKADFTTCLQRLVDDPDLRRTMGANARQSALTRTWEREFDRLLVLYDKCALGRSPRPHALPRGIHRLRSLTRAIGHVAFPRHLGT